MQRFWGRWAKWALPLAWGAAFAAPAFATAEDGAEAAAVVEEEDALPPVQPPVIQVDEVSVTAARAERAVLDQPGNITILTREDIVESGVNTIPELLRRQVGVYVTNTNGSNPTGINVEVRGFNNGSGNGSRTLVLIDGRRANLPQTGNTDWGLVKIDDVERIEIVRGPASAVYGDAAIGGVIEIFTRRASKKLQLDVTGRGGSYGMGQGSLFAGGAVEDLSGSVFVNGYTGDGYREHSDFTSGTVKANLRYSPSERVVIDVEGGYSKDQRDFPGTLSQANLDEIGRRAADPQFDRNQWKIRTGFLQGGLEWSVADDIVFKVQPTWREWKQETDVIGAPAYFAYDYVQDAKVSTTTVNAQLDVNRGFWGLENRLVVGADYVYDGDRRSNAYADAFSFSDTTAKNRRYILSAYLQEEVELFPGVILSGGVRFDYANYRESYRTESSWAPLENGVLRRRFDHWSPKAALTWRPVDPLSVYFSYDQGIRFPNFDEIYPVLTFGAGDLGPEKSTSYEVGAKFRSGKIQAGLALYLMNVDDEMILLPLLSGFGENVNVDRIRHRGIEASLSCRPWDWVEAYANFTYDNTEIREYAADPGLVGNRVPVTPEYRGTVGFNFFLPLPFLDVAELGVNANVVGPRYAINDLRNAYSQLPTYGTVDLHGRLGREIFDGFNLTFFFQVENLNGERYSQTSGIGNVAPAPGWPSQEGIRYYPSPGRNFDVGLTVSFER